MRQPVDAVAHHAAHGAGVIIGPDGLRAMPRLARSELARNGGDGLVPRDARK
jgi:hypothetical protein